MKNHEKSNFNNKIVAQLASLRGGGWFELGVLKILSKYVQFKYLVVYVLVVCNTM